MNTTTEWILAGDDSGDLAYWSNEEGWSDRESATRFSTAEMEAFDEPQGFIGWMPV